MKQEIRIGTRGSKLALWQANYIKLYLEKNFLDISTSIHVIQTRGDINLKDDLSSLGGKGAFVKEIQKALIENEIDIAVHSYKDLPAERPCELEIISVSPSVFNVVPLPESTINLLSVLKYCHDLEYDIICPPPFLPCSFALNTILSVLRNICLPSYLLSLSKSTFLSSLFEIVILGVFKIILVCRFFLMPSLILYARFL